MRIESLTASKNTTAVLPAARCLQPGWTAPRWQWHARLTLAALVSSPISAPKPADDMEPASNMKRSATSTRRYSSERSGGFAKEVMKMTRMTRQEQVVIRHQGRNIALTTLSFVSRPQLLSTLKTSRTNLSEAILQVLPSDKHT